MTIECCEVGQQRLTEYYATTGANSSMNKRSVNCIRGVGLQAECGGWCAVLFVSPIRHDGGIILINVSLDCTGSKSL